MFNSSGRSIWFLDTRVEVRVSHEDGSDSISVLEHIAPHGDSPPLHIHRNEDEASMLPFRFEDREQRLEEGGTVVVPKGIPHAIVSNHSKVLDF